MQWIGCKGEWVKLIGWIWRICLRIPGLTKCQHVSWVWSQHFLIPDFPDCPVLPGCACPMKTTGADDLPAQGKCVAMPKNCAKCVAMPKGGKLCQTEALYRRLRRQRLAKWLLSSFVDVCWLLTAFTDSLRRLIGVYVLSRDPLYELHFSTPPPHCRILNKNLQTTHCCKNRFGLRF